MAKNSFHLLRDTHTHSHTHTHTHTNIHHTHTHTHTQNAYTNYGGDNHRICFFAISTTYEIAYKLFYEILK